MKKITLALILAVLAALTAMFTLTSCGDAEDGNDVDTDTKAVTETAAPETDAATDATTDTATVANAETEGSVFPQALSDLPSYPITDLDYTSWEMAGGMVNGNDMTEEEFNAVLTACGSSNLLSTKQALSKWKTAKRHSREHMSFSLTVTHFTSYSTDMNITAFSRNRKAHLFSYSRTLRIPKPLSTSFR